MSAETNLSAKLSQLGLEMPSAPEPKGLYKPLVIVGNMAYTSGHVPAEPDGTILQGRLGQELDEEAGRRAAMLAGLGILATLRSSFGSLDRVRRLIKLLGVVNGTPDFTRQPAVIDGASQLLIDVFGPDAGLGARSVLGTNSLPLGVPVEIEAIFEIQP